MIKNYKQFNESLVDKLVGSTEDEVWNTIKDLSPNEILIKSCDCGFIKGVIFALDNGANVQYKNNRSICDASWYGYIDIVKLLIDKGADIHVNNDEPLKIASGQGNIEIVKLLLDNGCDVYSDNNISLKRAMRNGHTETVELLKTYMK